LKWQLETQKMKKKTENNYRIKFNYQQTIISETKYFGTYNNFY